MGISLQSSRPAIPETLPMRYFGNPEYRRSREYRRLHADPAIRRVTAFYAAAAEITRVLGRCRLSPFLRELGSRLEVANLERARQIIDGRRYAAGSALDNTADFVRFEQQLVQAALDELRMRDARAWQAVVAEANRKISRAGTLRV